MTRQRTHHEHGAEVAEISEQLLHGGLLWINGEELEQILIQRSHIAVHYHQLAVLLPRRFTEAVRAAVKVSNAAALH